MSGNKTSKNSGLLLFTGVVSLLLTSGFFLSMGSKGHDLKAIEGFKANLKKQKRLMQTDSIYPQKKDVAFVLPR